MRRGGGRLYAPDQRDGKFALARGKASGEKRWDLGPLTWDQELTPSCVGFGWAMKLAALPYRQFLDPLGIYELANERDEFGPEPHDGTSVRAAAKVLKSLGLIDSYRWTFKIEPLISTVLEVGPVVVGTMWYADMNEPAVGTGRIHVGGASEGGHAYLVYGVSTKTGLFDVRCAWPDFGNDGRAKLAIDDLERLIADGGEACLAVERKAGPR